MLGRSNITTRSTHDNMLVIHLLPACGCRGGTAMLSFSNTPQMERRVVNKLD
jgi:hypothetical protein